MKNEQNKIGLNGLLKSIAGGFLIFILVFICAGHIIYWQGWLYTAMTIIMLVFSFLSIKNNPELINERLNPGKGTKSWDKVYWIVSTPLFFIMMIISCLDAGRFRWSPELPSWVYGAAIIIYLAGNAIFIQARRANRFFSTVVRIQSDRGQEVCQIGPYRYVRHPGYLGGFLFTAVTPLLFGSLWGLILVSITVVLMIIRTNLEDKTLEEELKGYKEYKGKVKYKVIPYIW